MNGRFIKNKSLTAVNLFMDDIDKFLFKIKNQKWNITGRSIYQKVGQGRAYQLGDNSLDVLTWEIGKSI